MNCLKMKLNALSGIRTAPHHCLISVSVVRFHILAERFYGTEFDPRPINSVSSHTYKNSGWLNRGSNAGNIVQMNDHPERQKPRRLDNPSRLRASSRQGNLSRLAPCVQTPASWSKTDESLESSCMSISDRCSQWYTDKPFSLNATSAKPCICKTLMISTALISVHYA